MPAPQALADGAKAESAIHAKTHKEATVEKKVLDAMKKAGQAMRPGDIAKALGADAKEVSKAIDALKKAGKINSPKRCFYAPV
jgi:predicted transcriptional regulator